MPTRTQTPVSLVLISMVVLVGAPAVAHAQATTPKPAAPGARPGGTKPAAAGKGAPAATADNALRQTVTAYGRAVAEGDLQAMAKFWTADGDYVDPSGRSVKARQSLEKGAPVEDHPPLALDTQSLRMVTPDVALEDGVCELTPEGAKPIFRGRYTALWVKQQGTWLLSSLRESVAPPPSGIDRLTALEWMIGEWEADGDGMIVTAKNSWTDNKVYLLREIVIERDGRVVHSLMQRIAWDPLTRRIKGWTFDADGSMGEAYWTQQGDSWVALTSGVTRDGETTSGKSVYSEITADSFLLKSADAMVGSTSKPGFELRFKRLPADQ
jgi:uncharacterized protein (TIGR02246 family)